MTTEDNSVSELQSQTARYEKEGEGLTGELSTKANTHEMEQRPVELPALEQAGTR